MPRNPSAPVKRWKPPAQAMNLDRVGERQPEEFCDHGQRQLRHISARRGRRASFAKQCRASASLVARMCGPVRDGAAAKACPRWREAACERIGHRQHTGGKRAHDARIHPNEIRQPCHALRMVNGACPSAHGPRALVSVVPDLPIIENALHDRGTLVAKLVDPARDAKVIMM